MPKRIPSRVPFASCIRSWGASKGALITSSLHLGPIIVCFDGVCNVCSAWVTFLVSRDKKSRFRFAALQSETGQSLLKKYNLSTTDFETMLVVEGERVYFKSDAIVRVLKGMPWYWSLQGYLLGLVPRFLRDVFYGLVARNRYRWFGKKEQCMIPTPEIRSRFLN